MSDSNPLRAIEEAIAAAARSPKADHNTVKEWLERRKQFLDQEAQARKLDFDQSAEKSRTKFRRGVVITCVVLVFTLLAMLILRLH